MKAIYEIGGTNNPARCGDVIFVHGLNGDPIKTWSYDDSQKGLWPRWLAEDCPDLGVWSLGYEVAASAWSKGALPLFDRANNILAELAVEEWLGTKPICFITHSMGGLLVKKMLFNAINNISPEFSRFKDAVRGLIFLATPHTGSDFATFFNCLKFFRPTVAIKELESHAASLRELDAWYRNNAAQSIKTQVYFESKPTKGVLVVNASSSNPGIAGVTPISIDADHLSIACPVSRDELVYRSCKQFVSRILLSTSTATASAGTGGSALPTLQGSSAGVAGSSGGVLPTSQNGSVGTAGSGTGGTGGSALPASPAGAVSISIASDVPVDIFISYTQEDKSLQVRLANNLANLRKQGVIRDWHDGHIVPGSVRRTEIQKHLDSAQIILLLISPDYMAADFCYSVEMKQAIARHKLRAVRVLPILLRPTDYEGAPFAELQMLPSTSKAINTWSNMDEAFHDVIQGIRAAIRDLRENPL